MKGRSFWSMTETQNGSWSWNKLLRMRALAQRFVGMENGREVWKFPGQKYKAAAVWDEIRRKKDKVAWHRLVWNSFVVPKHAIIAWMAILNRLPTVDRLKQWGFDINENCVLCKQDRETRDHIFFECSYSKAIWKEVLSKCGLQRDITSWHGELKWVVLKLKGKALITLLIQIGWNAFIYNKWQERNHRVFRKKEAAKEQIIECIKEAIRYRLARLKRIATDPINISLHSSWGLLDSIFVH